MKSFDFLAPETLNEALFVLSQHGGSAKVIAGGTDLLLQMREGDLQPQVVISLLGLGELRGIEFHSREGLRIGALTSLKELTRSPIVREHYPVLARTASYMASEQVRSLATVGGNLCNGAPSADLAPPLLALGARVCVTRLDGAQWMDLEQFFVGPGETVVEPQDLLKEIRLPPPSGKCTYLRHTPRVYMDIAVVGVAAWVMQIDGRISEAHIALGAVAPVPLRARKAEAALQDRQPTAEAVDEAAKLAAEESRPIDDLRGGAAYRRHIVGVLTRRALLEALDGKGQS